MPDITGSVRVEVEIGGDWTIEELTSGWSDHERQKLLDGDDEAREELIDAAIRTMSVRRDDVSISYSDIDVSARSAQERGTHGAPQTTARKRGK